MNIEEYIEHTVLKPDTVIIRGKGKKITVILQTGLLTGTEIITGCDIYGAAGVDFV